MRVAFAGTPGFALAALERLDAAGLPIALVLTQPDRPAGRGLHPQPSAVKAFAMARQIALVQPHGLRLDGRHAEDAAAARAALEAARPDVIVVAAYGLILPDWMLSLPRLGCVNIHASLLPRWRGAAPIQRAIDAGDTATGVTIMQMDAGLDTGAMLLRESVAIAADDTTAALTTRLAALGGQLIVQALALAGSGGLAATPQGADGVTYAHKIDKAEAPIDWTRAAAAIERRLRAFDPFPGATTVVDGETVKCWRAQPAVGSGPAGTVLQVDDRGIVVACGEGALRLTVLQRPGARRLPAAEFLRSRAVAPGLQLGGAG